jgi:DHA3 family macrolide efflux protein-like MFS transporter
MKTHRRLEGMQAFFALLGGQLISVIGSGMTRFGLGVWILDKTGNTSAYTTMIFFAVFPAGLGALFTGPFIDRWDRRKLFIGANLIASLAILVMAILFFTESVTLWHLYLAMTVNGIASSFISPAMQSSARLLVPKEKLTRASGLSQLLRPMETILAPSLAGLIVSAFGLEVVFIIDVVTFFVNIIILSLLSIPRPPQAAGRAGKAGFWVELSAGFRYIRERPAFIALLSLFALTLFLLPGMAYSLITPLVLSFETEKVLGLILSVFGIGSIIGGIFLASWHTERRRMNGILIALSVAGLAAILMGLWENPWTIGLGVFLTGLSFVFVTGLNQVIWQVKSAPEMQGRLFALMGTLAVGGQSLGILVAGPLAGKVFQPMFEKGGLLANTIGALIGMGPGRGMGFMFILIGLTVFGVVLLSWTIPSIHLLEDRLPDHDRTQETTS